MSLQEHECPVSAGERDAEDGDEEGDGTCCVVIGCEWLGKVEENSLYGFLVVRAF